MVVRIQLTVRHVRGHTFPIETDVDSEVLGVKLQIWESQKIPIENQRLVFSGKELEDHITLSQMNIGDGATIFLVESMTALPQQPQSEIPQVTIQMPIQVVPPATTDGNPNIVPYPNVAPIATMDANINYFGPLEVETALSEERIQNAVELAYWVRLFCVWGMIFIAISCFYSSYYAIIPFAMFLCGFIGTRKVNRCLLVFPLLLAFVNGLGFTILSIYGFSWGGAGTLMGVWFCVLFIGLLHLMIFSCICKLITHLGHLSCQECCQARLRIQAKGCCC